MKPCPDCGTSIGDAVEMCSQCAYKKKSAKSGDVMSEIADHLKHINWNLGKIYLHLKGDQETIKKIEDEETNDTSK